MLHGVRDLPRSGTEPMSPALAGGFPSTVPPGKPGFLVFEVLSPFSHGIHTYTHPSSLTPQWVGVTVTGSGFSISLFFSPIPKRWIWSPLRLLLVPTILRAPIHFVSTTQSPWSCWVLSIFSYITASQSRPKVGFFASGLPGHYGNQSWGFPEFQPTGSIWPLQPHLCRYSLFTDPIMGVRPPQSVRCFGENRQKGPFLSADAAPGQSPLLHG